jgi:hypothetical protein
MSFGMCSIAAIVLLVPALDDLSVKEVEARAIAHRESIKSGIIKLESEYYFNNDKVELRRQSRTVVYWDGDSRRIDRSRPYDETAGLAGGSYRESVSSVAGIMRVFNDRKFPDGGRMVTTMFPADHNNAQGHPIPDSRLIGMYPNSYLNLVHQKDNLNCFLGNQHELLRATVEIVELDGARVYKLTYSKRNGTQTAWIMPDHNFEIARIETDFDSQHESLVIEHKPVEGFGFFPSHIQYRSFSDDKLRRSEDLRVDVVQLNKPVPPRLFTFPGMDVPVGTQVTEYRDNQVRYRLVTENGESPE